MMRFSDALDQYLDAREKLANLEDGVQWDSVPKRREREQQRLDEAATVMNRLAPGLG